MKRLIATATLLLVLTAPAFGGIIHQPGVAGHNTSPAGEACLECMTNGIAAEEPDTTADTSGLEDTPGLLVDASVYLLSFLF